MAEAEAKLPRTVEGGRKVQLEQRENALTALKYLDEALAVAPPAVYRAELCARAPPAAGLLPPAAAAARAAAALAAAPLRASPLSRLPRPSYLLTSRRRSRAPGRPLPGRPLGTHTYASATRRSRRRRRALAAAPSTNGSTAARPPRGCTWRRRTSSTSSSTLRSGSACCRRGCALSLCVDALGAGAPRAAAARAPPPPHRLHPHPSAAASRCRCALACRYHSITQSDENNREAREGIALIERLKRRASQVDHYKVLGISRSATERDIKRACAQLLLRAETPRHRRAAPTCPRQRCCCSHPLALGRSAQHSPLRPSPVAACCLTRASRCAPLPRTTPLWCARLQLPQGRSAVPPGQVCGQGRGGRGGRGQEVQGDCARVRGTLRRGAQAQVRPRRGEPRARAGPPSQPSPRPWAQR